MQTDIVKLQNAVAINRDEIAYRQLFMMFYTPLTRFSTNITQSEETAEELYTDMMMKIWLMGDKFFKVRYQPTARYILAGDTTFKKIFVRGCLRSGTW